MSKVWTLVSNQGNAWVCCDAKWSSKVWHGMALGKGCFSTCHCELLQIDISLHLQFLSVKQAGEYQPKQL